MGTESRTDSKRTAEAKAESIHLRKRRNHQAYAGWRV